MRDRSYRRRFLKHDLRRSVYSGGFSPSRLWDRIHGYGYYKHSFFVQFKECDCESYHECRNREHEWRARFMGCYQYQMYWGTNAPAGFRRDLNRKQRTREKAALRKAFLKYEFEDFSLPRHRHDVEWLYN